MYCRVYCTVLRIVRVSYKLKLYLKWSGLNWMQRSAVLPATVLNLFCKSINPVCFEVLFWIKIYFACYYCRFYPSSANFKNRNLVKQKEHLRFLPTLQNRKPTVPTYSQEFQLLYSLKHLNLHRCSLLLDQPTSVNLLFRQ